MSIKTFIPGIAWFFFVLVLICLPGDGLPVADTWMKKIMFEKWVHAGLFGILGYLFMWPIGRSGLKYEDKREYFSRIAIACCIWGLATEFIQKFFIPHRSFDWLDWLADSVGIALGYLYSRKLISK